MYRYAIYLLLHDVSSLSMLKTCSGHMKYTFAHSLSHIEQAVNTSHLDTMPNEKNTVLALKKLGPMGVTKHRTSNYEGELYRP